MQLALYIHNIGIEPNLTGQSYHDYLANLIRQFQQLEPGQRLDAKKRGRKLIRELGLENAAGHLVSIPLNRLKHERFRQKRLEQMKHWAADTPPCPTCKFKRFKLPKKSWPSKQAAEHELAKHKNILFAVYPCPAHEGYWHLGHPKQRHGPTENPNNEE